MPGVQKRMATQPQQHGRSKGKMSFGNPSANERQGGKKKVSEREGRAVDSREGDMDEDDYDDDDDDDDDDDEGEEEDDADDDNNDDDDDDDEGANGVESGDENNTHFSQEKSAKTQSTS